LVEALKDGWMGFRLITPQRSSANEGSVASSQQVANSANEGSVASSQQVANSANKGSVASSQQVGKCGFNIKNLLIITNSKFQWTENKLPSQRFT